jgi:hypothetical protein
LNYFVVRGLTAGDAAVVAGRSFRLDAEAARSLAGVFEVDTLIASSQITEALVKERLGKAGIAKLYFVSIKIPGFGCGFGPVLSVVVVMDFGAGDDPFMRGESKRGNLFRSLFVAEANAEVASLGLLLWLIAFSPVPAGMEESSLVSRREQGQDWNLLIASLGGIDANPPSEVSALDLVGGCGLRESFYAASICGKKRYCAGCRASRFYLD